NGNGAGPKVRDRLCQIIRQHKLDPELVKAYAVDFCGVIAMVAPPAQRAVSVSASPGRRRRPVSATSAALVTVAAALIALALYRLLSSTSGLRLGAGWATVGIAFGVAAAV